MNWFLIFAIILVAYQLYCVVSNGNLDQSEKFQKGLLIVGVALAAFIGGNVFGTKRVVNNFVSGDWTVDENGNLSTENSASS